MPIFSNFMAKLAGWIATIRGAGTSDGFDRFMQSRKAAALSYINGDAGPLDALVTHEDPATFFHPKGDLVRGASSVQGRCACTARASP
jgi:hypothetical protein